MNDVVVVGAGPAGSATALWLARAGRDVRIIERARFPRRKVCGEYLNPGSVAALERLGVADAVRAVASPLRGVRLVPPGGAAVSLHFPRPALSCPREALDAIVLDAALAAGAKLERGRVDDLIMQDGACAGVRVRAEDGTLVDRPARVVVGADGIGSIVARKLGLTLPIRRGARYAVGGHYGGFTGLDEHIEMYVGRGGYFALNPLDTSRANVMVVVPRARLARWSADVDEGVGGAAAALGRGLRSFDQTRRLGSRVSIGPLAHAVRASVAPGAVLVGDAAGFLDPFTGQGIFLALTGAERAAAAICEGRHEGYARWRADDLASRRRLCAVVATLIDVPPLARRTATRLSRFPEAGATLVEALTGIAPPRRAFTWGALGRLLA